MRPISELGFWISEAQRVSLKQNLNVKGWKSQAHREFPGKFESSNLSRIMLVGRLGVRQSFEAEFPGDSPYSESSPAARESEPQRSQIFVWKT